MFLIKAFNVMYFGDTVRLFDLSIKPRPQRHAFVIKVNKNDQERAVALYGA